MLSMLPYMRSLQESGVKNGILDDLEELIEEFAKAIESVLETKQDKDVQEKKQDSSELLPNAQYLELQCMVKYFENTMPILTIKVASLITEHYKNQALDVILEQRHKVAEELQSENSPLKAITPFFARPEMETKQQPEPRKSPCNTMCTIL